MGSRLRGRFGEVYSVTPEEAVERALAIEDEVGDRAVEQSHHKSENQVREVGNHLFECSNPSSGSNRAKDLIPAVSDKQ